MAISSTLIKKDRQKNLIGGMEHYEVHKYMNKNQRSIQMPHMEAFKRASDSDPGQSSPRSHMEVSMIKNLITSYFGVVKKTTNDMVPKTIMAFLVNKTKNMAQRELVQKIYQDGQHLDSLLQEDQSVKQSRDKSESMVKTLKASLDFLNEVRDFYFDESNQDL